MSSNIPNTRPSSPRSNATTPRPRGDDDDDDDDLDLSQIRSTLNTPDNSRPSTPSLLGGQRKYTNIKGKQLRRHTKRRIHRKVSNRRAHQNSRLRRRNNLK